MIKANSAFAAVSENGNVPFTIDSFGASFETLQDSGEQPGLLHNQGNR
jgi:hypothetical protein